MDVLSEQYLRMKQEAINRYSSGNYMEAKEICEDLCKHDSADAEVYCLLGMVYGQLNQFRKSVESTRKAIELSPDYLEAHFNMGLALGQLGELKAAAERFEFVLSRKAEYPDAFTSLGYIEMIGGDLHRAAECYRTARLMDPRNLDAVAGEADILEMLGEDDKAMEVMRPYTSTQQEDADIALVNAKLYRKRGEAGAAIDYLERFVDRDDMSADTRSRLHFMLGNLYDETGRYDEGYPHFVEANQLKGVYFDSYRFRFDTEQQIKNFSESSLKKLARSKCTSDLPVFIVGMPRSGTSLVEQILASHKVVYGAGELDDIREITADLLSGSHSAVSGPKSPATLTSSDLTFAADKYIEKIRGLSETAVRITDKMPGNYFSLGYIELMFPNARVIHCRRNPVDTCLSCYFQNFAGVHSYAFKLEDLGLYYLEYRKLMDHWKKVLTLPIYEITYEDLVTSQERSIRDLVEFCGLDWDDHCLNPEKTDRIIKTASYQQARKKIYTHSVARWKNYEQHIRPLLELLGGNN